MNSYPQKNFLMKVLVLAQIAFLSACTSYEQAGMDFEKSKYGEPEILAQNAKRAVSAAPDCDELLWTLEAANSCLIAKDFSGAKSYLEDAFSLFEECDSRAENAADAILLDNPLHFKPTYCDRILTLSSLALIEIQNNNLENALDYLQTAQNLVDSAPSLFASATSDEVKKLKEALSGNKNVLPLLAKSKDAQNEFLSAYGRNPLLDDSSIVGLKKSLDGAYENSFVPFLAGLARLAGAKSREDIFAAQRFFEQAQKISPKNSYLIEDIRACDFFMSTQSFPRTTYVVYESGYAPNLYASNFTVPMEIAPNDVVSAQVEKPTFAMGQNQVETLQIFSFGTFYRTEPLMNVFEIEMREFSASLPARLGETILRCVANADGLFENKDLEATYEEFSSELARRAKIEEKMRTDLRFCSAKPSLISYARFMTPSTNNIIIENCEVQLTNAPINIVFVRRANVVYSEESSVNLYISVFGIGK